MSILFQIVLYQSLFLLAYQLIKKESFFQLNRFYLLVSLIASIALPFVELNWFQFDLGQENLSNLQSIYLPEVFVGDAQTSSTTIQEKDSTLYVSFLENIYIVGFSVALSLLYLKIETLIQLIQENVSASEKNFKIVSVKQSKEAFSFYHYVFLGTAMEAEERKAILLHEQQHVRLKHSIDNSLLALIRTVFWFNPLLYFYQKELQLIHEYQADERVCRELNPKTYAWQLLNTAFQTNNMGLMSSFYNKSFIKNRIMMLQKKESNKMALLKYAILTPILVVLVGFSSIAQENLPKDEQALLEKYKKEITELVEKQDMSVYYDYTINANKDEKGVLTKKGFYKMKAFATLAYENGMSPNEKVDQAFIKKSYAEYREEMNKKKVVMMDSRKIETQNEFDTDVPFAAVDRVPVYPGCDENLSNQELRNCMSKNIQEHINKNFDTSIIEKLRTDKETENKLDEKLKELSSLVSKVDLERKTRIYVRFTISKNGEIANVEARSAHPDLSKASEDAVKSLPKMKPGMHKEENVNVIYTLPITLLIPEKEENEEEK